jgi:hypothetical protein
LQSADLSPKDAAEVGKQIVELAAQAREGEVVRVHILAGGAVGVKRPPVVAAELREVEES